MSNPHYVRPSGVWLTSLLCVSVCTPAAFASDYYKYTVISATSNGAAYSLFRSVSINDSGLVAFSARQGGSSIIQVGPPLRTVASSAGSFSGSVQINNNNQVLAQQLVLGNPGNFSFLNLYSANIPPGSTQFIAQGNSSLSFGLQSIFPDATVNNNGSTVFTVLDRNLPKFATTPGSLFEVPASLPARPMLADNNDTVYRDGNQPNSPIVRFTSAGSNPLRGSKLTIAASTDGFTRLGQSPGISDDGQVIVFYGERIEDDGISHPGIFASIEFTRQTPNGPFTGRRLDRIAGVAHNGRLEPGETFNDRNSDGVFNAGETDEGPILSFSPDDRAGVNATQVLRVLSPAPEGTQPEQRGVTFTYVAFDRSGVKGLFSNRLNLYRSHLADDYTASDPGFLTVTPTIPVARQGDILGALTSAVVDVGLYDPINSRDRGDIAFWVDLGNGSSAILRARPQEVVFVDFNPVGANVFSLITTSVLARLGLPTSASFDGAIADVFRTNGGPGRTDLNGPGNAAAIQDRIVDSVQGKFDNLNLGSGPGVNVKVLGHSRGESLPTEGPFTRVFIGDSPFTDLNPGPVVGIAPLSLFNQGPSRLLGSFLLPVETTQIKVPLIFVDELFRLRTRAFTDATGLRPIDLSETISNPITVDDVVNSIATAIAHEVGHALGLNHLSDARTAPVVVPSNLIMNRTTNPSNSYRSPKSFGIADVPHDPFEPYRSSPNLYPDPLGTGSENSGARLALSVGSDTDVPNLPRRAPSSAVLAANKVFANLAIGSSLIPGSIRVARAVIGVVQAGVDDIEPAFIDLGAGDLATILQRTIPVGNRDKVFLVASTSGSGIDIFGVAQGFTGNVRDIDLTNGLLMLTDQRIRASLFNASGQPIAAGLTLFQQKTGGPFAIGTFGPTVTNPAPIDVTFQVRIIRGGFVFDRATARFVQQVTLTNTGTAINGPVSLVLDSLSSGATLANKTGVTSAVAPFGDPYVDFSGTGLGAGASTTVRLDFANPGNVNITYNTRVLAGAGTR